MISISGMIVKMLKVLLARKLWLRVGERSGPGRAAERKMNRKRA
jgi:hypothetical protein